MLHALLGFAAVLVLAFLGVPLGFAMLGTGLIGFALFRGWDAAYAMVGQQIIDAAANYGLSVLPMFILMGVFIHRSELAEDIYRAAHAWIGHLKGGLAHATVLACGMFGAVSGSSIASAATMSMVAIPPMRRLGYADSLSAGCVASAGTLSVLIPPSVPLLIYGIIAEQDIGKLFIAGIIPGILLGLLFMLAVSIVVRVRPGIGPPAEASKNSVRWRTLGRVWPVLLLFGLVIGGLYFGLFTATEAAGIGAAGAFLFACWRRKISWDSLLASLIEAAKTTAMIFVVVFGAMVFANYVTISGMVGELLGWMQRERLDVLTTILAIALIYLILGALMDTLGMLLITVPVFAALVEPMGVNLIWFGIFVTIMAEIGLLTPPVGMNVFTVKALHKDIPLPSIFIGITPFLLANFVLLAIIIVVPQTALYLVQIMGR